MSMQQTPAHDELNDFNPSPDWLDPESADLLDANDALSRARNRAIDLLTTIEDITLHQNPQISAEWQVEIGVWENRLLKAQIDARKAKRRFSLAQACVNVEERVDSRVIEEQLDKEFEQWQQQLEDATAAYQLAVQSRIIALKIGQSTATELKKVFRTLAKRLHPDLHPELDEASRHMFTLAELAYRKGDLEILRSLEVSTRGLENDASFSATVIEAQAELTLVEAQVQELEERLEKIKAEKPYCLRKLLLDKEWVAARTSQLEGEIAELEEVERTYQHRYEELVNAYA